MEIITYKSTEKELFIVTKHGLKYSVTFEISENEGVYEYAQFTYMKKPLLSQVLEDWYKFIDSMTDDSILNGFEWDGNQVELDMAHLFDYKMLYDFSISKSGSNLPLTLKLGTSKKPIYYKFLDMDTLKDFYENMVMFILNCLNNGWEMKLKPNWKDYSKILAD